VKTTVSKEDKTENNHNSSSQILLINTSGIQIQLKINGIKVGLKINSMEKQTTKNIGRNIHNKPSNNLTKKQLANRMISNLVGTLSNLVGILSSNNNNNNSQDNHFLNNSGKTNSGIKTKVNKCSQVTQGEVPTTQ